MPDPKTQTWEQVAHQLGARMRYYANGCNCEPPHPHDCPFCADRAAWLAYQAKTQQTTTEATH